jgi:hypothetical protein
MSSRARVGLLLLLGGCTADQLAVESGAIIVSVATSGVGSDPDGYVVGVDGMITRTLPVQGSVVVSGLRAGDHRVSLSGWTPNCLPVGRDAVTLSLDGSDTVSVTFQVACTAAVGSLQVSVVSTGSDHDLDPDGYILTLDGEPRARVETKGTFVLSTASGQSSIGLEELSANCIVDDNPRTVEVPLAGIVSTRFDVTCEPAESLAFEPSSNLDPAWRPGP